MYGNCGNNYLPVSVPYDLLVHGKIIMSLPLICWRVSPCFSPQQFGCLDKRQWCVSQTYHRPWFSAQLVSCPWNLWQGVEGFQNWEVFVTRESREYWQPSAEAGRPLPPGRNRNIRYRQADRLLWDGEDTKSLHPGSKYYFIKQEQIQWNTESSRSLSLR